MLFFFFNPEFFFGGVEIFFPAFSFLGGVFFSFYIHSVNIFLRRNRRLSCYCLLLLFF